MGPDRRRMRLQMSRAQSVVDLLRSIKIGIQRTFGVNHEFAPPRQADNNIRAQPPIVGIHRNLGTEIGVRAKACLIKRSEERRVGKGWVSRCRYRWSPSTQNKKKHK